MYRDSPKGTRRMGRSIGRDPDWQMDAETHVTQSNSRPNRA